MEPATGATWAQPGPPPTGIEQLSTASGRKIMKVMVALDESNESFYALKWTLDNLLTNPVAGGPSTAPLVYSTGDPGGQDERYLLYVVNVQQNFQSFAFPAGPAVFANTTSAGESVRKAQAEITQSLFAKATKCCNEKRVRSETLILEGSPKEMICQAAEQMHVDLLVVGSRGLGQVKRAFLGSVSDYCAHHAACPVLIVKPSKDSHHHKK